jgi:hypothetical protein
MRKKRSSGVLTALTKPFTLNGTIDEATLRRTVDRRIDGVIACRNIHFTEVRQHEASPATLTAFTEIGLDHRTLGCRRRNTAKPV